MRHVHLLELEDQPWFPGGIRAAMTDLLSFAGELTAGAYQDFVVRLREAMARTGERRLVDLCSGGGGPARSMARMLRAEQGYPVDLLLTDLYPNLAAWERLKAAPGERVDFAAEPVDATRVPADMAGFRLLCKGFHHFRPEAACAGLRDAVAGRRGVAIFEGFDPGPGGAVQPFVLLGMMLALTPLVRPFRWSRLLYTYVVPAAPLSLLWDGVVSWLRIYSEADLRELVEMADPARAYEWEIGRGRVPGGPLRNVFLIGIPRQG